MMLLMLFALGMTNVSAMAAGNPCNPCSMKGHTNPCNPCAIKKPANPCNPCAMKKPANPCSMKQGKVQWGTPGNKPIREHAFDNFSQAVALGRKLWHDEKLGTSGTSCASCHAGYQFLHFDRNQNFPHFVNMVGDVVTLDQMINYCMLNPMKGKEFARDSKELTALAAYFRAYRMQYLREHRK
ncbi:MAG: hypothetical protein D6703_05775 [Zetaproteobacteria bacterium]|nr:MAG: hypothetical protein D6703_05775 [Zetaproteobacteria bacterium]